MIILFLVYFGKYVTVQRTLRKDSNQEKSINMNKTRLKQSLSDEG